MRGKARTAGLTELTRRLVGIDTTSSGSNLEAATLLADHLEAVGARVEVQRWTADGVEKANVVGSLGPPVSGGLILSGHIDAVPFVGQPGWTRDPLTLEVTDERLFGRGTSDMKVFLAQCVVALEEIDVGRLERPVVLLFTADEETGCTGALRLAEHLEDLLGEVPPPDVAWIGEPTSWEIFRAHKGIGVFDVVVHGRGGHSGRPESGVNAIAVASRLIERLRHWQDEKRERAAPSELFPESAFPSLNLGTIRGGTAANMIADECRFQVSFRCLPETNPEEILQSLTRALLDVDARDFLSRHTARVEITTANLVPGMLSASGSPLETVLGDVLGRECVGGALFAADGCRFAPLGITTLIAGPGELDQAHQPDESISRRAFEEGPERIGRVVTRLCAG